MQYQQTLHRKFGKINKLNASAPHIGFAATAGIYSNTNDNQYTNGNYRKPAVVCSIGEFLTEQQERINRLINKKRKQQDKWNRIASANMKYRQQLRNKIQQSQQKHSKERKDFLQKRVKKQKFKIDQVQRKRGQLLEHRRSLSKKNQNAFKQYKSQTIQYWQKRDQSKKRAYETQVAAAPLYEQAKSLKKMKERSNIQYGQKIKQQLLSKHSHVKQRIQDIINQHQKLLDSHNQQIKTNQERNNEILQNRKNKFINTICFTQDRSEFARKKNIDEYNKKQKNKQLYKMDHLQKIRDNIKQRNQKKANSLKECVCHDRVKSAAHNIAGLTQSVFLNEETGDKTNKDFRKTTRNYSVQAMRQSFLQTSQLHDSNVKQNKQIIRQNQDMKDQKKLMIQKQISEAVRQRQGIRNQSNCLVRKARINA